MRTVKTLAGGTNQIGIDMGSSQIRIYRKHSGIILSESSVAAVSVSRPGIAGFGTDALVRYHNEPERYRLEWPVKNGVMADYHLTKDMLQFFLNKALHQAVRRPVIMMAIPSGLSSVGRHALIDAVLHAGAQHVYLIHSAAAAVLGAGLEISLPEAVMSLVVGRDLTDCGLFTCGGVVAQSGILFGGHGIDEGIRSYLQETYHMMIGSQEAEEIKREMVSVMKPQEDRTFVVRGRRTHDGVEVVAELSARELYPVMQMLLMPVIQLVKKVLRSASPEMAEDLLRNGLLLSGGSALLKGISDWIAHEIGIPVLVAQSPEDTVAAGCGTALSEYRRIPYLIEDGEQYYGGM
jgi:rod shape-determining protein MreB